MISHTFLLPAKRTRGRSFIEPMLHLGITALLIGVGGCKDLSGSGSLPAGTPDPKYYGSKDGAIGLRNGAVATFELGVRNYLFESGLISDELEDNQTHASSGVLLGNNGTLQDPLDERVLPEDGGDGSVSYSGLQQFRGAANLALNSLATYDTAAQDVSYQKLMRGQLYAYLGYAEILLADLYCSGVPLSTLDFQKDFTPAPSSSTAQVYQDALAKLDSAVLLASASDSVQKRDSVVQLARILRGRANLALGKYREAADDVTTVPVSFRYQLKLAGGGSGGQAGQNFINSAATVSDNEGTNGFPYRSDGDPRTTTTVVCTPRSQPSSPPTPVCSQGYDTDTLTLPNKYYATVTAGSPMPFIVADGIEAQLIVAEAALSDPSQGDWLAQLNALRASAGVSGLSPLSDPGTPKDRVALLFKERAYWLFLTGHREGDLRRLLRQYSQYFPSEQNVYPTGIYTAPGIGRYGSDVNVPIPSSENSNPNFHGCLNRNP